MKYLNALNPLKLKDETNRLSNILNAGDYYCATDSRTLLAIPKKYFDEPIEASNDIPDISFIFSLKRLSIPLTYTIHEIREAYELIPKTPDHDDCEQCDGWGKINCSCCDSEIECKECSGSGEGELNGEFYYDSEYALKFDESYISTDSVGKLVDVFINLDLMSDQEITLISSEKDKPLIFEIGDILFVTVPTHNDFIPEDKRIIL